MTKPTSADEPPTGAVPLTEVLGWIITGSVTRSPAKAAILTALDIPAPEPGEEELDEPGRRAAQAHAEAAKLVRQAVILGELRLFGRRGGVAMAEAVSPLLLSGADAPVIAGNELHGRHGALFHDLHLILTGQDGAALAAMREAVTAEMPKWGAFGLRPRGGRTVTSAQASAHDAAAKQLILDLRTRLERWPSQAEADVEWARHRANRRKALPPRDAVRHALKALRTP